jgi:hypothetical protein
MLEIFIQTQKMKIGGGIKEISGWEEKFSLQITYGYWF